MRDPYLYKDVPVLRNRFDIKDEKKLKQVEADITAVTLMAVDNAVKSLPFDFSRLCAIHKHVFEDVYDWAGNVRTIPIVKGEPILSSDTVRYSQPDDIKRDAQKTLTELNSVNWPKLSTHKTAEKFAKLTAALWQSHPFREGNTRTTIAFATQFAEAHGFRMDKSLLKENAAYVRNTLVKASDGPYSEYKYLTEIFANSIRRGDELSNGIYNVKKDVQTPVANKSTPRTKPTPKPEKVVPDIKTDKIPSQTTPTGIKIKIPTVQPTTNRYVSDNTFEIPLTKSTPKTPNADTPELYYSEKPKDYMPELIAQSELSKPLTVDNVHSTDDIVIVSSKNTTAVFDERFNAEKLELTKSVTDTGHGGLGS
jgi:cell filamentation protein